MRHNRWERERETEVVRRKWRHHCRAKIGDKLDFPLPKIRTYRFPLQSGKIVIADHHTTQYLKKQRTTPTESQRHSESVHLTAEWARSLSTTPRTPASECSKCRPGRCGWFQNDASCSWGHGLSVSHERGQAVPPWLAWSTHGVSKRRSSDTRLFFSILDDNVPYHLSGFCHWPFVHTATSRTLRNGGLAHYVIAAAAVASHNVKHAWVLAWVASRFAASSCALRCSHFAIVLLFSWTKFTS